MDHRRSTSASHGSSPRDGVAQHTSSAFSASAQPNEDWTKISDLAERRRIQNRIAQRNYRKKLKRKLEDLERKAASTTTTSLSEPQPDGLLPSPAPSRQNSKKSTCSSGSKRRPSPPAQPALLPQPRHQGQGQCQAQAHPHMEDWTMFSDQHTRQVSTSPPPFQFPSIESFQAPASPQLPANSFSYLPAAESAFHYQPFLQPSEPSYPWDDKTMPIKHEGFPDSDVSPLNLPGYMPMNHNDISFASSFSESSLTPELCDMYEYSSVGSPGDFNTFPLTPLMIPLSPPVQYFE